MPLATANPGAFLRALRPGDIVLVEGNTRVSTAIKYLTQSDLVPFRRSMSGRSWVGANHRVNRMCWRPGAPARYFWRRPRRRRFAARLSRTRNARYECLAPYLSSDHAASANLTATPVAAIRLKGAPSKFGPPYCLDFKTQIDNCVGIKFLGFADQRPQGLQTSSFGAVRVGCARK